MLDTSLDEIGARHGTDKASTHNDFLNYYERFLRPKRDHEIRILEIGVKEGRSLRTWEEYFPNGHIVGVDINESARTHATVRSEVIIADQSKVSDLNEISHKGPFDLIIDDGSHVWPHQILTFKTLIHAVKPGGYFIVEDLDTSYGKYASHYGRDGSISAADYLLRLTNFVIGHRTFDQPTDDTEYGRIWPLIDSISFYRGAAIVSLKR